MGDDVNPLVLRVATLSDADILLAWRNDRETRRQSKSTDKVEQSSHVSWLTAVLNDDDRALYIGMDGRFGRFRGWLRRPPAIVALAGGLSMR